MILPVIMAGGTGSRLWPLSRELYPKQFLAITGEQSMLQQTVARLSGIEHQAPLLICNEEHRFIAAEQLRLGNFEYAGIILEPVGRNTAPAIALAALQALKTVSKGKDPILLVLAADHLIENTEAFHSSVERALPFAQDNQLVTFGIMPTAPETGYGYIKTGEDYGDAFSVQEFVELQKSTEPFQLIDVREDFEYEIANIEGLHIPLADVEEEVDQIVSDRKVVVHCKSGGRSKKAIQLLEKEFGFSNLYNLTGGVDAYFNELDAN